MLLSSDRVCVYASVCAPHVVFHTAVVHGRVQTQSQIVHTEEERQRDLFCVHHKHWHFVSAQRFNKDAMKRSDVHQSSCILPTITPQQQPVWMHTNMQPRMSTAVQIKVFQVTGEPGGVFLHTRCTCVWSLCRTFSVHHQSVGTPSDVVTITTRFNYFLQHRVCPRYPYKIQREVFYHVAVFYLKDGALIELSFVHQCSCHCHGHDYECDRRLSSAAVLEARRITNFHGDNRGC